MCFFHRHVDGDVDNVQRRELVNSYGAQRNILLAIIIPRFLCLTSCLRAFLRKNALQDSQDDAPKLLAMARSPHTAHTLPLRTCWLTTCPRRVLPSPSMAEADESDDSTAEVDDEAETDEDEAETDEDADEDDDEAETDEADDEAETDEDDEGEEEEASVAEAAETGPWSCAADPATSSLFPVSMAESIVEEGRACLF